MSQSTLRQVKKGEEVYVELQGRASERCVSSETVRSLRKAGGHDSGAGPHHSRCPLAETGVPRD